MSENVTEISTVLVVGAGWVGRQIAACCAKSGLQTSIYDSSQTTVVDALKWIAAELEHLAPDSSFNMNAPSSGKTVGTANTSPSLNQETAAKDDHGSANEPALKIFGADKPHELPNTDNEIDDGPSASTAGDIADASDIADAEQAFADLPDASDLRIHQSELVQSLADLEGQEEFDLVIECVPEMLGVKKRALRQLSARFSPPTLIASNSSYFVPSILAKFVDNPERFAHCHFHVPVLRPSVADVVGCDQTSPSVLDQLAQFVSQLGHKPIRLNREHPGYVFNWLLQAVLRAALELKSQDVASTEDIDQAWASVTGMPLGPFGIMDQIGLDVVEHTLHNSKWSEDKSPPVDDLLAVIKPLIASGRLGKKTLGGFYQYGE